MGDELLDVFDENNKFTGKQRMKSQVHAEGLWYRSVHIWLYNNKGEILFQLRDQSKKIFPGLWDSAAAGHVKAGETPEIAAQREITEELGLYINLEDLEFVTIAKNICSKEDSNDTSGFDLHHFTYVYLLEYNESIEKLRLEKHEVSKVQFFSSSEIKNVPLNDFSTFAVAPYWREAAEVIERKFH